MRGPLLITAMPRRSSVLETRHSHTDEHPPLVGLLRNIRHRCNRRMNPSLALQPFFFGQFDLSGVSLSKLIGDRQGKEIGKRLVLPTPGRSSQLKPAERILVGFRPKDLVCLDLGRATVDADKENVV